MLINSSEQYESTLSLLSLLRQLSIPSSAATFKEFEYAEGSDWRICNTCCETEAECTCQLDAYDISDDFLDTFMRDEDTTPDKKTSV